MAHHENYQLIVIVLYTITIIEANYKLRQNWAIKAWHRVTERMKKKNTRPSNSKNWNILMFNTVNIEHDRELHERMHHIPTQPNNGTPFCRWTHLIYIHCVTYKHIDSEIALPIHSRALKKAAENLLHSRFRGFCCRCCFEIFLGLRLVVTFSHIFNWLIEFIYSIHCTRNQPKSETDLNTKMCCFFSKK